MDGYFNVLMEINWIDRYKISSTLQLTTPTENSVAQTWAMRIARAGSTPYLVVVRNLLAENQPRHDNDDEDGDEDDDHGDDDDDDDDN